MPIKIFIDNMAWDIFFEAKLDLTKELPSNEFSLYMTKEAEFEIPLIPDVEKRQYVESFINSGSIKTDVYFGFYDERHPSEKQRVGGFGEENEAKIGGRFIEEAEATLIQSEASSIGSAKKKTGLYNNEADASLAARSLYALVLTCDLKNGGPLKRAKTNPARIVIDLNKYQKGTNLADFIKSELFNTVGWGEERTPT